MSTPKKLPDAPTDTRARDSAMHRLPVSTSTFGKNPDGDGYPFGCSRSFLRSPNTNALTFVGIGTMTFGETVDHSGKEGVYGSSSVASRHRYAGVQSRRSRAFSIE